MKCPFCSYEWHAEIEQPVQGSVKCPQCGKLFSPTFPDDADVDSRLRR